MTTLQYNGIQQVPPHLKQYPEFQDMRLYTILATTEERLRDYVLSTRTVFGLRELGII